MMKNSIFLILLFSSISLGLFGQRGHHPTGMPFLTDEDKAALSLSPEQLAELDRLQSSTKMAIDALQQQENMEREDKHVAMRKIHQQAKAGLSEILSPEQRAALRNIREEQMAERKALLESVDYKGMKAALHAYDEEHIRPVMNAQRLKLEDVLSDDEQLTLAKIRSTLREARENAKAERAENRKERREGERQAHRPRPHGDQVKGDRHPDAKRARMDKFMRGEPSMKEKHPEEYATLTALAEKYDTDITALLAEIKPQREEWDAAKKAIRERFLPEELRGQNPRHKRGDRQIQGEKRAMSAKIKFLLMDINAPEAEEELADEVKMPVNAYPNPAVNTTTLDFELVSAATVRIDLRDEQGAFVKNISRESYKEGKNQVNIDLSNLQNGTYYITLNSKSFETPKSVKVLVIK